MRCVVQRVKYATLSIDNKEYSKIEKGLCVFVGVGQNDDEKSASFMADKICNLRIFEDENGKMNLSLLDVGGEILAVSQFTLYADCSHGRRPSFINAAPPQLGNEIYEKFVELLKEKHIFVKTGVFGADMQVNILNDGPVTINLDTDLIMKK